MIGEKIFNLFITKEQHQAIKDCSHLRNKSMQEYIKIAIDNENKITLKRKEK